MKQVIFFCAGLLLLCNRNVTAQTGGSIITTIAGTGVLGYTGYGTPATAAQINAAGKVAIDHAGNIYFADAGNNVIRKISSTGIITTIAGWGVAGYSGDGGDPTAAQLNNPQGVVVDNLGNIYVADAGNNRIRKISTTHIISTVAGNGTAGNAGDGGPATAAKISYPVGVTLDRYGNMFIADANNNSIRKVDVKNNISSIVFGCKGCTPVPPACGTIGFGDGGPAYNGMLYSPSNVIVDTFRNLFIADTRDGLVRKINTSGIISSICGNGCVTTLGDGGPATAVGSLGNIYDVTTDAAGNLYFTHGVRIRKIDVSGILSTIAGNGIAGHTGDGGAAKFAELQGPTGVVVDSSGNLYINDGAAIRKVSNGIGINNAPSFVGGKSQRMTYCQGIAVISPILAINDLDVSQTETWTVNMPPSHGSLGGFPISYSSTGSSITPKGLSYTSAFGYAGADSFAIQISDGIDSTVTVVHVTVTAVPSAIVGASSVCSGSTTALTDTVSGGFWSSTNSSIATISTSGILTGFKPGTSIISYTLFTGCWAADTVTVNPLPSSVTGTAIVSVGGTTSMTDVTTGGKWSSSNSARATVGGTGLVTGVASGTATISYTLATGCAATRTVSIVSSSNNVPAFIGGASQRVAYCQGTASINSVLAITDADTAQTEKWIVTANPVHGTLAGFPDTALSTAGIVTPSGLSYTPAPGYTGPDSFTIKISDGIDTSVTKVHVTVNPVPAAITGSGSICGSSTTTLTDADAGGVWTSSNAAIASVSFGTGVVTGGISGVATISYSFLTGCFVTKTVTVSPTTSTSIITGAYSMTLGSTTTLSDTATGGVWTSSNTSIATVGSATGVVTSVAAGSVIISYTITNSCGTTTATKTLFTSGTTWYSTTTGGDLSVLTNWWSVNNNTGVHPTTFSDPGDTWVFQSSMSSSVSSFSFGGSIQIISTGVFTAPSSLLNIGGYWSNTGGIFNNNNATVNFNGTYKGITITGNLTGSSKFKNLTFNGIGGGWSFGSNLADVNGNFTIINGTVTSPAAIFNITGNWSNSGSYIEGVGGIVNVSGNWTNNGTFTNNGGSVNMIGTIPGLIISGTGMTGTNKFYNLVFNGIGGSWIFSNAADIGGNFTVVTGIVTGPTLLNVGLNFSISGGSFISAFSGVINVGGNWFNGGSFIHNNCSVILNGSTTGLTLSGQMTGLNKFYNITFNGTGSWSFGTYAVDVANDYTITIGTVTAPSTFITVSGNWYNTGIFIHNNCTVIMNATVIGKTLSGLMTGTSKFYNLTFNGSGSWSFGSYAIDVANNFSISFGSVIAPSSTLSVGGNWTNNGVFTNNGGTVIMTGTTAGLTLSGTGMTGAGKFFNLTFNGVGGSWLFSNLVDIGGNFTIISGSIIGSVVFNVSGNFIINGGSFTSAFAGVINVGGNWFNAGIFIHNGCTVNMVGIISGLTLSGNMTGANKFNVLIFNGTGGFWSFGGNSADVAGNFTIINGTVVSPTTLLNITGNWSNGGTYVEGLSGIVNVSGTWSNIGIFTNNGGTVNLTGITTGLTLSGNMTAGNKFYNLTFNGSGGSWSFLNLADVGGNFTILNGIVTGPSTFNVLLNFSINGGSYISATSGIIYVGGNWFNSGIFIHNNCTVTMNGTATGLLLSGNMTLGTNGRFYNLIFSGSGSWTFGVYTADIAGNFSITGTGSVTGSSTTLNILGNWTHTGTGLFIHNNGSVIFSGNLSTLSGFMITGSKFNNISFTGGGTYTFGSNADANGNFIITNGTVNPLAGGSYHISGNWNIAGTGVFNNTFNTFLLFVGGNWNNLGIFNAGAGTVTMNGVSGGLTVSGNLTGSNKFYNLIFNGTGGNWMISDNIDMALNFTILAGTVTTITNHILNVWGNWSNSGIFVAGATSKLYIGSIVGGNWNNVGGIFTASTCTVNMVGTIAGLTISGNMTGGSKFNILNFNGVNGSWTFSSGDNTDVAGTFTIQNGTVNTSASHILSVQGNWTNYGTFNAGATSMINESASWFNNGIFNAGTGTVNMNGLVTGLSLNGNMTLATNGRFYNLTFNGVGGSWSLTANIDVLANFTIITGVVNTPAGHILNVTGNWSNSGTYNAGTLTFINVGGNWGNTGAFSASTSSVNMIGTTAGLTLSGLMTSAGKFYNLTFNGLGGQWSFGAYAADVANDFIITAGKLTAPSSTLRVAGNYTNNGTFIHNNGTLIMNGTTTGLTLNGAMTGINKFYTLTFDGIGGAWSFGPNAADAGGDFSIINGIVTAPSTILQVAGNWINSGTFNHNNGLVNLFGTFLQHITGVTRFYNVTLDNTIGAIINNDETIDGTFTIVVGVINIGINNLVFGPLATISGVFSKTAMIIANSSGQIRRQMTGNGSFLFPVGDNALNYSPITINFSGGTYNSGAYYGINVMNAKQPSNANINNYLARYWSLISANITSPAYEATLATYLPGDVVGTESLLSGGQYSGHLPWSKFTPVNPAAHSFATATVKSDTSYFTGITTQAPIVNSSLNSSICVGDSSVISTSGVTGDPVVSYSWAPVAGLGVTTGMTITATPALTTVYTVTITDANGFTGISTTTITVDSFPAVYKVTGGGDFCNGGTGVVVGLSGSGASSISYQLYNDTTAVGSSKTGKASSLDFGLQTIPGIYRVVATDISAGCKTVMPDSTIVTVTPLVTPSINIAAALFDTVCAGSTATFNAKPTNQGTGPYYQWKVNNIVKGTDSTGFSYVPTDGDVVVVTLLSNAYCAVIPAIATDEITMNVGKIFIPAVTINASPGNVIAKGQDVRFAASATNAGPNPTYQWYNNGAIIPGATTAFYSGADFNNLDSVTCIVLGSGVCGMPSFNSIIMHVSTTGINKIVNNIDALALLPNPNTGTFTINLSSATDVQANIIITNILGEKVKEITVATNTPAQINMTAPAGIYFVIAITEHERYTSKMILK